MAPWKLPVIFVCENNKYGSRCRASARCPPRIADRAAGYGMPGKTINGNDLPLVYEAASRRPGPRPAKDRR